MVTAKYIGMTCIQFAKNQVYSIETKFENNHLMVYSAPSVFRAYKSLDEFYNDWEVVTTKSTSPMTVKAEYIGKKIQLLPGNEYDVKIRTVLVTHNHRKTVMNTVTVYDGCDEKKLTYPDLENLATDWKLIK